MKQHTQLIIRYMVACIASALIACVYALPVYAADQDSIGTTQFQFLKMDLDARAIAMGGAFTAVADEASTLRYNPAGLRMLLKKQVMATHLLWFQNFRGEYVAYGQPMGEGQAFGMSMFYLTADDIQRRDEYEVQHGFVGFEEKVIHLGWATRLDRNDNTMFGVAAKYMDDTLDYSKKAAVAFDVGVLARVSKRFSLGASYRNIGIDKNTKLPTETRVGVSFFTGVLGLSADTYRYADTEFKYAFGGELLFKSMFSIRAGYNTMNRSLGSLDNDTYKDIGISSLSGASFGMGFNTRPLKLLGGLCVHIDYAFANFGRLGESHIFSFSTEF